MKIIDNIAKPVTSPKPIELLYCLQASSMPYHWDTKQSVPGFCKCDLPVRTKYESITRLTECPIDGKMYDLVELIRGPGYKTIWLGHWNDGLELKMR